MMVTTDTFSRPFKLVLERRGQEKDVERRVLVGFLQETPFSLNMRFGTLSLNSPL